MLPPFLHSFYFSFEVLEHLYLGNYNSALNFNSTDNCITISFVNGDTYFSYTFSADADTNRTYMIKSEISNEKAGIRYLYTFDDDRSEFGIPSSGTVNCIFSVPEKQLSRFRENLVEHIKKCEENGLYEEVEQYRKCLDVSETEFQLKYKFFNKHRNVCYGNATPYNEYIIGLLREKNEKIVYDFGNIPSIQYIETHNASHKLLLDKEDKNNYLAQTIESYVQHYGFQSNVFIEKWIREFKLGYSLKIEDISGEAYRISIIEEDGSLVPLAYKGTGTIQFVILLMRLSFAFDELYNTYGGQANVFFIEEPEQNMHPSLQSKLSDIFYEVWKKARGRIQFVIETHSEYLVRRTQVLVAQEGYEDELSMKENNPFKVYYFDGDNKKEPYYPMVFRTDGKFSNEFGTGFFDTASNLAFELF